jgi:hypothetical protein
MCSLRWSVGLEHSALASCPIGMSRFRYREIRLPHQPRFGAILLRKGPHQPIKSVIPISLLLYYFVQSTKLSTMLMGSSVNMYILLVCLSFLAVCHAARFNAGHTPAHWVQSTTGHKSIPSLSLFSHSYIPRVLLITLHSHLFTSLHYPPPSLYSYLTIVLLYRSTESYYPHVHIPRVLLFSFPSPSPSPFFHRVNTVRSHTHHYNCIETAKLRSS